MASEKFQYFYDANGTKLRNNFYEDNRPMTTTDYSGPFVYTGHHPDHILTSEGRLKWDDHDNMFYPEYFIKDHLGNVRVVLTTNPNFTNPTIQVTDYYPFGLEFQDVSISDNRNLYNSKELQTDAKLWWYDYGARFYDPVIGRWNVVDPLAEKYVDWSPYNYVGSNPIKRIDPDGMDWDIVIDHDQQTITIQANFKTFANNDNTVQASADTWNAQSGKFNYVVGKGDDAISYSVNFDISVNDGSNEASAPNMIGVAPDDSKVFTDRARTEDGNKVTVGGLSDGSSILMPKSHKESVQKTSHEMGHNLGMGHTSGLMAVQGGKELKASSVNETLKHSGVKEKTKRDESPNAKLRNTTVVGEAPNNFNNGNIKKNEDWKKKDFN